MQRKKILVLGGSGLLGLNWAISQRKDHDIILALHTRKVQLSGVELVNFNSHEFQSIEAFISELKPDIVVNTSGLTSVELCEKDPYLAYRTNTLIARNVAAVCNNLPIKLIHISTDHLFQGNNQLVDENEEARPLNVYGETKYQAETEVQKVNAGALIVRTNFYGWGPSYRSSFTDIIINKLRSSQPITLFSDVFFTPILISELVKAILELIEMNMTGIYHIVGDERISKYDFGLHVAEIFDLDQNLIQSGLFSSRTDLVQRPLDMSLSNKKLCETLSKKIGSVDQHLQLLLEQENSGFSKEIICL